MKSLFTSKTFLLALVQAVGGIVAAAIATDPNIATLGYVVILKSLIDIALRIFTSEQVYIK